MEVNSVRIARDKALKGKGIVVRDQANNRYFSRGNNNIMIWNDDEQTMLSIMSNPDFYSNQKTNKPFLISVVSYVDILSIDGVCDNKDMLKVVNDNKSLLSSDEYQRAVKIYDKNR